MSLDKKDIALVILRIDKRCGRDTHQTIKRIGKYTGLSLRAAETLYFDAFRRLTAEKFNKYVKEGGNAVDVLGELTGNYC